jgi:L-ascorbate metabolism protein UlaG (beta-lactamase superfamily)
MIYRKVETVQSHEALLNDIQSAEPAQGSGAFWWMGQHTFIVKAGGTVIYIDPFFANWPSRQTPSPLAPSEARYADIVLVTHGHGDHLDPESLRAMVDASPNALFVCPRTEAGRMIDEAGVPAERLRPINAGERLDLAEVHITAVKSKHESFDEHPELGFPFLGYAVEVGGVAFYHAGDTIMYDGLVQTLAEFSRLDAMFLPINGRDAERFLRGCLGNFTFQEAVELAGELRPGLAVPAHYDMFIGNQEDPQKFVDFLNAKFPGVSSWVGPVGERVSFGRQEPKQT